MEKATRADGFSEKFGLAVDNIQHDFGLPCTMDVLFLCFLRMVERFGYFHLGPVTINVRVVEERVEATVLPGADPHAVTEDWVRFSRLLMQEVRNSGRKRLDELHYLFAFMRCNEGIAAQVFGELGVTPAQVEAYLKTGGEETGQTERWMTPEEVADYLRVHVQTVRAWIRGGKLPARRVYGMRSLRVRAADAAKMLRPIDEEDDNTAESSGGDA